MTIQTLNTLYKLEDKGDGAFLMSGNKDYFPEPLLMRAEGMPVVGRPFWSVFLEGPRKGRSLRTSTVVSIDHD